MSNRKPIIVGNWKLNKTIAEAVDLATAVRNAAGGINGQPAVVGDENIDLISASAAISKAGKRWQMYN